MSPSSADARVTAYVFGELSESQRNAFEKELADSDRLRDEVAAIHEAVAAVVAFALGVVLEELHFLPLLKYD